MKNLLLFVACFICAKVAISQPPPPPTTTVIFKPDAIVGEDATIVFIHDQNGRDCIPAGYTQPVSTVNFGSHDEFIFSAWTYNDGGCPLGETRELIRFTELSTIPPDASIASATLVLHGPVPTVAWGNNLFPGTPLPNENSGWLKRVLPGSANAWDENTVTWASQPNTDPNNSNWVRIDTTQQRWGWTQKIDVTTLVTNIFQELQTNPDANNGFMLMLQNDTFYRAQCYASSDNSDTTLWPELVITYSDCHAGFGYCVSTDQPSVYNFTAYNQSLVSYEWKVDGVYAGNSSTLNYDFGYSWSGSTSHTVTLKGVGTDSNTCERFIEVCGSSYVKNGGMTYNGNPTGCNPIFTYCTGLPNNQNYTFTAQDPLMSSYTWKINGSVVGTGPTLNYSFPIIGDYEVELDVLGAGTSCFSYLKNFCVSPVYLYKGAGPNHKTSHSESIALPMIKGDDPTLLRFTTQVGITPNPGKNGWNVDFSLYESEKITITLFDISGKQIKSIEENGKKGNNLIYFSSTEITQGMYIIEIKGKQINTKLKVVKN